MSESSSSSRRVAILIDTETHMMPALAREMASRDHNLVIANVAGGLVAELEGLGAEVEVIPDRLDMGLPGTFQRLTDVAKQRFGRFDSACVRTGHMERGLFSTRPWRSPSIYMKETSSRHSWRYRSSCRRW